jgi:hypothetical protein
MRGHASARARLWAAMRGIVFRQTGSAAMLA